MCKGPILLSPLLPRRLENAAAKSGISFHNSAFYLDIRRLTSILLKTRPKQTLLLCCMSSALGIHHKLLTLLPNTITAMSQILVSSEIFGVLGSQLSRVA